MGVHHYQRYRVVQKRRLRRNRELSWFLSQPQHRTPAEGWQDIANNDRVVCSRASRGSSMKALASMAVTFKVQATNRQACRNGGNDGKVGGWSNPPLVLVKRRPARPPAQHPSDTAHFILGYN